MEPIDVLASLQKVAVTKRGQDQMGLVISTDGLFIHPSLSSRSGVPLAEAERAMSADFARAMADTIHDNLTSGRLPDGTPMRPPSAATLERREYRQAQSQRGGELGPGFKDNTARRRKHRSEGVRRFKRRFTSSAKTGGGRVNFTPTATPYRGFESGLLSWVRVAQVEGSGHAMWAVFFPVKRTVADRTGTSALERVLGGAPLWTERALNQPAIVTAAQRLADGMIAVNKQRAQMAMLESLKAAAELVQQVTDEAE